MIFATCSLTLLLIYPYKAGGVVASEAGIAKDDVEGWLGQGWFAGKYPEVIGTVGANEGVGVVAVDHHDAIVGIENPEETDSEKAWDRGGLGYACTLLPLTILQPTILDLYGVLGSDGVGGATMRHAAFEAMVEADYLVPRTDEALHIEMGDGTVVDGGGGVAATYCKQRQEDK